MPIIENLFVRKERFGFRATFPKTDEVSRNETENIFTILSKYFSSCLHPLRRCSLQGLQVGFSRE